MPMPVPPTRRSVLRACLAGPAVLLMPAVSWALGRSERRLLVGQGHDGSESPGDFALPESCWYVLGSAAASMCGCHLPAPSVSAREAAGFADALEAIDIPAAANLFLGLDPPSPAHDQARAWLCGPGCERRVRAFTEFLRGGAFRLAR